MKLYVEGLQRGRCIMRRLKMTVFSIVVLVTLAPWAHRFGGGAQLPSLFTGGQRTSSTSSRVHMF